MRYLALLAALAFPAHPALAGHCFVGHHNVSAIVAPVQPYYYQVQSQVAQPYVAPADVDQLPAMLERLLNLENKLRAERLKYTELEAQQTLRARQAIRQFVQDCEPVTPAAGTPTPAAPAAPESPLASDGGDVAKILANKCASCHSGAATKGGGFKMFSDTGSLLQLRKCDGLNIFHEVVTERMPKDSVGGQPAVKLTPDESAVISDWIYSLPN